MKTKRVVDGVPVIKKFYRLIENILFRSVFSLFGFIFSNPILATVCDIFIDY